MILSDAEITQRVFDNKMIDPFSNEQITHIEYDKGKQRKVISYGVSSYGYDIRLGSTFKIFTNVLCREIDPKNFDNKSLVEVATDEYVLIPPNSFVLAMSYEYIRIPRDILAICLGKSTYARCGIVINVTPLEPEWHGNITIEISNTTPLPARVYANEGICQLIFLQGKGCDVSYADKGGKYQGQTGVMPPML